MAKPNREALAKELLELRRKYEPFEARDKEICAALKEMAGDDGSNFQVKIEKLGLIKVSAPKEKSMTGTAPEIVVEAFLRLSDKEQIKLKDKGLVVITEQWKAKYYGSVTVELF